MLTNFLYNITVKMPRALAAKKEYIMLKLKGIKKDYLTSSETVHALRGIDLCFRKSEFVSILGPSGCGKTTLLNIVGGLDHYTDGDLIINGRSTKSYKDRDWDVYRNHRIGFIFQSYNLIPHQTVLGNVELALTIAGIGREERIARAKEALDKVGLEGQYYKRPNQLSGGQCQRVAIARALVNDPEILLADEPTGALDTVTSVQIMELIKEISDERLVIMVTHNPELAEEYSTRIIRLLDGEVTFDSNPMTDEEIEEETNKMKAEEEASHTAFESLSKEAKRKTKKEKRRSREKAKMSFFTALRLSARNLWTKRGRTAMVGFAGSIGIIGIATVIAFSTGIKGYIASMQDDMLSGNPIQIQETTLDLQTLTGMVNKVMGEEVKIPNMVYVFSLVEYIIKSGDAVITNDISKEYIDYVSKMPSEYYNAMLFNYGIDMNTNVFVDFKATPDSDAEHLSMRRITDMYKELLKETEQSSLSGLVDRFAPSLQQAPNNPEYILSQYDLLGDSRIATEKNEVMLVLDFEDQLSDLLLARLGYFSEVEFIEIINKANSELENEKNGSDIVYDEELYRDYFTYEELLDKTLTWYPVDTVLKPVIEESTDRNGNKTYNVTADYTSSFDARQDSGLELEVVGILVPKEGISFGSLESGIYYTEALTEYAMESARSSEFIDALSPEGLDESTKASYDFTYSFSYYPADAFDGANIIGEQVSTPTSGFSTYKSVSGGTEEKYIRALGGNDLPNGVSIYPISFDDKYLVTAYLDQWNDENVDIDVNGEIISGNDRDSVTYTDSLEIIIFMINTMIDIISYALIAFTSISLVVSTVMIGIITYVSVVERVKEIGVIRSLGGRKRDVSALFNAETFIIGLLAGLIGIGATYGISFIVNMILAPMISYSRIASLHVGEAVALVVLSVALTLVSGLFPAKSAAKKDPVVALRTE